MQLISQKLSQVKCALLVLVVFVAVAAAAWILTHLILGSLALTWRYPAILVVTGCLVGLVLLIWLFPLLSGLAVVAASGIVLGRFMPAWAAIIVAALLWWLPANMGISWSQPWTGRWKYQEQLFLIRGWQMQIWLLAYLVAYACPFALLSCVLYLCYRRFA